MKYRAKLIEIILSISMITALFNIPVFSASPRYAYDVLLAETIDGATKEGYQIASGRLGSMTNGQGYYFESVDFGKISPKFVEVGWSVPDEYAGSKFQLVIDSLNGTVLTEFIAESTGGWNSPVTKTVPLSNNVVGTHKLFIKKIDGKPTNFYSVQFIEPQSQGAAYKEYDGDNVYDDTQNSRYRNEINVLTVLGIIDKKDDSTSFYPELYISRGEFAKMVYRLLNIKDDNTNKTLFEDVKGDKELSEAVNYLAQNNIITDKGKFYPASYVTSEVACGIMCRALGYTLADNTKSYRSIAMNAGILKGFSTKGNLRKDEAAKIIYNTAVSYCIPIEFLAGKRLEGFESERLITRTMGINLGGGLVSENAYTSVTSPVSTGNDLSVKIDNEYYNTGKSSANSLLGYECEFLYRDDDEKEILHIWPSMKVDVTTINGLEVDIESITPYEIRYEDSKKIKRLKLEKNTNVIYNGVAIDDEFDKFIENMPFEGYIKYVKNPGNVNVLFINEYKNYVVDTYDLKERIFKDKITGESIKFETDLNYIYFNKDGKNTTARNIKPDDSIVIYTSKNKSGRKLIRADILSDAKKQGRIEQNSIENIVIDGKTYKKSTLSQDARVGRYVDFYVNPFNQIIFMQEVVHAENIGLYYRSYIDENDEKLHVKLCTMDNKQVDMVCHRKVIIDGKKTNNNEEAKKILDSYGESVIKTPVVFATNQNMITKIDTAKDGEKNYDDKMTKISVGEYQYESGTKLFVNKSKGIADSVFAKDGKFLMVENEGENIEDYKFMDYKDINRDLWGFMGEAYGADKESGYADVMVINSIKSYFKPECFYKEIYNELDENDVSYLVLKAVSGGGEVEYRIESDMIEKKDLQLINYLKLGDLIKVKLNKENKIEELKIIYSDDGKTEREYYNSKGEKRVKKYERTDNNQYWGSSNQIDRFTMGKISKRFEDYAVLSHNDGSSEIIWLGGIFCSRCRKNGTLESGIPATSLQEGDFIYVNISNRKTKGINIFEK